MILGDVHAEFGKLNALVNKKRPGIDLHCGDFGSWLGWAQVVPNGDSVYDRVHVCLSSSCYIAGLARLGAGRWPQRLSMRLGCGLG